MEGSPSNGAEKLFNRLCQTHEIFGIGKYYKKIKFDKVWGYQNGGFPFKRGFQNFELLNH